MAMVASTKNDLLPRNSNGSNLGRLQIYLPEDGVIFLCVSVFQEV